MLIHQGFNSIIEKLSIVAKETHAIYGINSQAALFDTLLKDKIVAVIVIPRIIIPINPNNGLLKPKNRKDHNTLKKNCIANQIKAIFLFCFNFFSLFSHTKNNATPIKKNNVVHAGPNNQLGGAKKGFAKEAYQLGMLGKVKIDPEAPTTWHKTIATINLTTFPESIKLFD